MNVLSYSTIGMCPDTNVMLWRICYELEELQEMTTALLSTELGAYLTVPLLSSHDETLHLHH
jgi:hypothetical protein